MKYLLALFVIIPFCCFGQDPDNSSLNNLLERKDRALLFAIDQYDQFINLNNPIEDALAIEYELKERFGYDSKLLTNPTADEIIREIRNYAQLEYKPFDQLLIFFAGHGTYDDIFKEGYLISKDSEINDETFNSYISHSRLRTIVNSIPSNHTLLVIDACFSGTFNPKLDRGNPYREKTNFEFVRNKLMYNSRKYLTSGGKEYVSDGIKGQHSPFASKLLEALRSNGGEDGILTMTEIYNYMEKISPTPHYGTFGDDEPGSDFLFISKETEIQSEVNTEVVPQRNNLMQVYNKLNVDFGIASDLNKGMLYHIRVGHSITPHINLGIEIGKIEDQQEISFDLLPGFGRAAETIDINDAYIGLNVGYRFAIAGFLFDPSFLIGAFNGNAIYNGNIKWIFLSRRLLNLGLSYRAISYPLQKDKIEFDFYGSRNVSSENIREYLQLAGLSVSFKIR